MCPFLICSHKCQISLEKHREMQQNRFLDSPLSDQDKVIMTFKSPSLFHPQWGFFFPLQNRYPRQHVWAPQKMFVIILLCSWTRQIRPISVCGVKKSSDNGSIQLDMHLQFSVVVKLLQYHVPMLYFNTNIYSKRASMRIYCFWGFFSGWQIAFTPLTQNWFSSRKKLSNWPKCVNAS